MRALGELALLLALVGAASCTSTRTSPSANTIDADQARSAPLYRGDGRRASWSELVDAACAADVVFVGENHGHPLGLASAAALFDDVLEREARASLSMEFLERDEQIFVDDYLSGVSSLDEFMKATGRTASNFPPGHRAMVESAKRASRRIHAANAPRRYVSLARREGYERLRELSFEQRRTLRVPDALIEGRYRDDFDRIMAPRGEEPSEELRERLDAVYRSQQVWDWTMARSVADALLAGERPVVHVVGNFHVNYRGGTVQALERELPGVRALVVSFVAESSPALAEEHRGRGDFVLYVGPAPQP